MTHSCALRPAAQARDNVYSLNLGSELILIHPIESNLKLGSEPTLIPLSRLVWGALLVRSFAEIIQHPPGSFEGP